MQRLLPAFLLIWLALPTLANAKITLPNLFTDHMVIQRERTWKIWGHAPAGEKISIEIAGKKTTAEANAEDAWSAVLEPLPVGGPHTLTVKTGAGEELVVKDILVGDVWICSGQSNMQWTVRNSNDAKKEIAGSAEFPKIRLITVPRKTAEQPQAGFDGKWMVCGPESIGDFSAVGYFFGRAIHREVGVPIGLINTSYGGTPAEAWTSRAALESRAGLNPLLVRWDKSISEFDPVKAKQIFEIRKARWKEAAEKAKAEGKNPPPAPRLSRDPKSSPHRPASLYHAMITPLTNFAIRGAIWYQGESNASRAYQYRSIFPTMIRNWRSDWGQGNFPFLFVQLANFRAVAENPGESAWAELREAQSMTLSTLPNMGQAVAIDIGEANDIHPRNKQEVGRRLALCALAGTYGGEAEFSGPSFSSYELKGKKILLRFTHLDGGLAAREGKRLEGFAIAGEDRKFVWARATTEGTTVSVSHRDIPNPVAVRYAWAENPRCNLINEAGLPASPFRTDDWPGATVNSH